MEYTKWEYKVITILECNIESYLNDAGQEGWECIHIVTQLSSPSLKLIFKRKLNEDRNK